MIFYRLALKRLIEYLEIGKPSLEQRRLDMLMHRKPKVIYKTKLKTDKTMNLYISILLSIIGALIIISIPFGIVESPCEVLRERGYHSLYRIAIVIEKYSELLDLIIILLVFVLIYVTWKTLYDGIKNTNINISPWIERGKYTLPNMKYERPPDN